MCLHVFSLQTLTAAHGKHSRFVDMASKLLFYLLIVACWIRIEACASWIRGQMYCRCIVKGLECINPSIHTDPNREKH